MNDDTKSREELIAELNILRRRCALGKSSLTDPQQIRDEGTRFFTESANDIFYILTQEGVFTYVSPNLQRILGYHPQKFINQSFREFVHSDDVAACDAFLKQTLENEAKSGGIEYRARHNDGSWRWFTTDASPLFDADGKASSFLGIARDITKYKQIQEALIESEEKYRLVVENAGEAILIAQEGIIKLANRRAEEVTGYSRTELQSEHFSEFIHPDDRALVLDNYRRRMRGESVPTSYEFKTIAKDGSTHWVENHSFRVPWNGRMAALNFFLDITDRKRADEALNASEILYRTIFENTGTIMLIVEEDMTITLVNDRFNLTGYCREEVEGKKKWTDFVAKEDLDKMVARHRDRRSNHGTSPNSYEFRLVRADGSLMDMLLTVVLIPGTKRSIASMIDITDRKRMEEALRESEEKYRNILENINDGYFEVDLQGNMVFGNHVLSKLSGYTWEEIKGMNYRCYIPQEDQERIVRIYRELYAKNLMGRVISYEIIRKDGVRIPVEASLSTLRDNQGRPFGYRGIVRDVSERKQKEEERRILEDRLQQAEKMEAIGMLAGGVAHDLNNVLGILVGYSELILFQVDESSPIRDHVLNIKNGAERAAAIVQDLLTLARRGVHTEEVVNLNTIVRDLQKTPEMDKLCSFHPKVQIRTNLAEDLLNIVGSPVHLDKTLFNLISNAAEAMPGGGEVTIATRNQYLDRPIHGYDDVRDGDYIVLSVADTGQGIAPVDLKRIFEPFYTKKAMGRSGTGLGLSVVWGTVKDHHAYIDVQSEKEKGTCFDLYFPVERQEISSKPVSPAISSYLGRGESVLIVDDVAEQRYLASLMLQKLHYQVTAVASGEEAVAYLKANNADLLVLDMIMDPGMDGLDTYIKILERRPEQKAVITSGFSETERVKRAVAMGAGAYVRKPYVLEKLGMAVRKELDRK
jgi:PAS domain S-box-containing protein